MEEDVDSTMAEKVLVAWSGGKDSAFALHEIVKIGKYKISAFLTTVTEDYDRISMHGVRQILLEQQAKSLGFPLVIVLISRQGSNEEYEERMEVVLKKYLQTGVRKVVFGDIFLEDLKKYREEKLATVGMTGIFPIWKRDTKELAHRFIELGFRSVVTCVDSKFLDGRFAGREINEEFLRELPPSADPCGENGEFHSFVYDGPIFKNRIAYDLGGVILRDNRFYDCDLLPA